MTLTFGSLFSGIGGIDLGFERAGMTCSWQVEIDDYCNKVLAKHWPDVRRYRDVKEVGKHNLEPVDVITGGFPCQPHSVAGKRKGAADDRNLWPEYLRIITELRPAWVVGENVPGIITTYLDTVLSDLESANYTTAQFNIPTGSNHIRSRLFIIAYTNDPGREQQRREIAIPEERLFTKRHSNGNSPLDSLPRLRKLLVHDTPSTRPRLQLSIDRKYELRSLLREAIRIETESRILGVTYGIPNRVDRLRGLGNAVVPAVAEFIGKQILAANSP